MSSRRRTCHSNSNMGIRRIIEIGLYSFSLDSMVLTIELQVNWPRNNCFFSVLLYFCIAPCLCGNFFYSMVMNTNRSGKSIKYVKNNEEKVNLYLDMLKTIEIVFTSIWLEAKIHHKAIDRILKYILEKQKEKQKKMVMSFSLIW